MEVDGKVEDFMKGTSLGTRLPAQRGEGESGTVAYRNPFMGYNLHEDFLSVN